MISPILFVKIGAIRSERVGHLALDLELCLLNEKELNNRSSFPKMLNIFYTRKPISNSYLFNLWKKKVIMFPFWLILPLDLMVNKLFFFREHNFFNLIKQSGHTNLVLLDRHPPLLEIPKKDLPKGREILKNLGIKSEQPYVCLAVRDSRYLQNHLPDTDWSYHDYRDSDIRKYLEMSEYLASKGYAVLRMGRQMKGTLNSNNPLIIDYANSEFKSSFADVYIYSNCEFCISTSTGMDALATIFRKPLGLVNIVDLNSVSPGQAIKLFQPKHFFDNNLKRKLSYKEICDRKLFSGLSRESLGAIGVELKENTSQELKLFAEEFLTLLQSSNSKEKSMKQESMSVDFTHKENDRLTKLSRNWLQINSHYLN